MSGPELDRAALTHAGLAFVESPARTDARRVEDAISAYLYTATNIRDGMYPSWMETRESLGWDPAEAEAAAARNAVIRRINATHGEQAAKFGEAVTRLIDGSGGAE